MVPLDRSITGCLAKGSSAARSSISSKRSCEASAVKHAVGEDHELLVAEEPDEPRRSEGPAGQPDLETGRRARCRSALLRGHQEVGPDSEEARSGLDGPEGVEEQGPLLRIVHPFVDIAERTERDALDHNQRLEHQSGAPDLLSELFRRVGVPVELASWTGGSTPVRSISSTISVIAGYFDVARASPTSHAAADRPPRDCRRVDNGRRAAR